MRYRSQVRRIIHAFIAPVGIKGHLGVLRLDRSACKSTTNGGGIVSFNPGLRPVVIDASCLCPRTRHVALFNAFTAPVGIITWVVPPLLIPWNP